MPSGKRPPHAFSLAGEVRDYECDLQGIVNNAVYQNYLEHARHVFLKQSGIVFSDLAKSGTHLVIVRAELDYKAPLRSGDAFEIGLSIRKLSPVRIEFTQDIFLLPSRKLLLASRFECAAMDASGRPIFPRVLDRLFAV